jgi:hypothetical protein
MHRISGIELRRLGIVTSAGCDRRCIDSAMVASGGLDELIVEVRDIDGEFLRYEERG